MVEGDSSARKRVLYRGRDASGITIGGDGNRPRIVHLRKGGAYVLSDGVRIANFGDMTVLYVPPHRRLRRHVLRLRPASAHILGSQPLDYDGDDDDDDLAIYEHYRTDCVKYIYIYRIAYTMRNRRAEQEIPPFRSIISIYIFGGSRIPWT